MHFNTLPNVWIIYTNPTNSQFDVWLYRLKVVHFKVVVAFIVRAFLRSLHIHQVMILVPGSGLESILNKPKAFDAIKLKLIGLNLTYLH